MHTGAIHSHDAVSEDVTDDPTRIVLASMILTLATFVTLYLSNYHLYRISREISNKNVELAELRSIVLQFDEVLTMSTHMAVAVGDPRWEQRYLEHEPRLEAAIRRVNAIIPESVARRYDRQMSAANNALVLLEKEVFALVRDGRRQDAQRILASDQYSTYKREYGVGVHALSDMVNDMVDTASAEAARTQKVHTVLLVLAIAFLLGMWTIVLRTIRRWNRKLIQSYAKVSEQSRALAALNTQLEARVSRRTVQLEAAQEKLLKEEKLAALGKIIAVVNHELRNPLGTIQSSLFAIGQRTRGYDLGIERTLSRAERNVRRCEVIIDELSEFTRSHSVQRENVLIDDLIREIVDEHPVAQRANLNLDLAANTHVNLDPEYFRRCLVNVVDNALHAMGYDPSTAADKPIPASKSLVLRSRRTGDTVIIEVEDNGTGIPQSALDRIFEPLFSTKSFGVGLGLSIVRGLVNQLNGTLDVESSVGLGTTVRFTFPID